MTQATVWMPFYWGDYLAETAHLSTEEHGAYLLLIGAYWQAGGPLADDDRRLARITRLSLRRWKVVRETLVEFFTIRAQKWHLKRVDDDLSATKKRHLNRVEGHKKRQGLASKNQQNQCQNPVNSASSQAEHSPYVRASPPPPPQYKKEEQVCSSQKDTTRPSCPTRKLRPRPTRKAVLQQEQNHDPQPKKTRGPKTRGTRRPHDWRPEPGDSLPTRPANSSPDSGTIGGPNRTGSSWTGQPPGATGGVMPPTFNFGKRPPKNPSNTRLNRYELMAPLTQRAGDLMSRLSQKMTQGYGHG